MRQRFTRRGFLAASGAAILAAPVRSQSGQATAPDDSGRPVDPPAPGYYAYRGTSGPGLPASDANQGGGWVSGAPGLRYRGPQTMPFETLAWDNAATGSAVTRGLIPPLRPLMDLHIRDPQICIGHDGAYYMTGSTGDNIWKLNDGVELWRSTDLAGWTYLGLVWSIERDGVWEKQWRMRAGVPFRALWAPEIHFIRGNYFICHSMSRSGLAILRSASGRPEGPYVHAFSPEAALRRGIDSTLFEDEDGAVYFTYGSADEIVRLRDDLSGYAEDWRPVTFATPDRNPAHHREQCARRGYVDIGYEGASIFKRDGLYHLAVVDNFEGRYSFAVAVSENIYGPYRDRYEAVPCGGGGNIFRDREGRWWCTFFGNDDQAPFREMPSLVRVDFGESGRIVIARDQPFARNG